MRRGIPVAQNSQLGETAVTLRGLLRPDAPAGATKSAAELKRPRMIFVVSMSGLFHKDIPTVTSTKCSTR